MNESEKLYMESKKKQMEAILNSKQYQKDQQHIMFDAILEDLLLLKLEENPDLTGTIKYYLDAEQEIITKLNQILMDLNKKIEELPEIKEKRERITELADERYDLMKNFYKSYKNLVKPKEESISPEAEQIQAGVESLSKSEQETPEKPEKKIKSEQIEKEIDKELEEK